MTERPVSLELGSIVGGKYRLLKRIGEGGHGRVYRAVNILLGREVAVKVLKPELVQDETAKKRFFREAKVANKIRHANVVDVIDVGDSEIGPWMVQELLSGEPFSLILQREKQLSITRTLDTLLPVIAALSVAHAKGIAHRDFKPENIFLVRDETGAILPKILDFGLSKGTISFGTIRDSDRVTGSGVVVGTPAYLAPERVRMESEGDISGDIWSIGVVLYECVSGDLPFPARSVREMFVQIGTSSPIPLEDMLPSVDPEYARIVGKCLKRDPKERYASASELETDLLALRNSARYATAQSEPPPAFSSEPPPMYAGAHSTPPKDAWGDDIVPDSMPPRAIAPTPLEIEPEKLLAEAEAEDKLAASDQSENARASAPLSSAETSASPHASTQQQENKLLPWFVVLGCIALVVVGWFATRPRNAVVNPGTENTVQDAVGATDASLPTATTDNSQTTILADTDAQSFEPEAAVPPTADAETSVVVDALESVSTAVTGNEQHSTATGLRNTGAVRRPRSDGGSHATHSSPNNSSTPTIVIRDIR